MQNCRVDESIKNQARRRLSNENALTSPLLSGRVWLADSPNEKPELVLWLIFLGKNRDKIGLMAAILEAANSGAPKTRIMINANLSFKLLKKYLGLSMQLGYVELDGTTYKVTNQGRTFLFRYKRFVSQHAQVQKSLHNLEEERAILDYLCKRNQTNI
ncbi:MAG: winged helix-turn-helix domain-containing protein [Candidatus Bathyarchaeia archaeon]|jgi:predicted transcriptional regulator